MTLFYATDFADRLENEIIPALRAGFVVLTDRYIYSMIARATARGEDRSWIEKVASFALVPHATYYLRAEVKHLVARVVVGRGAFDYWESGMDMRFGDDMYESFVRYQTRLIRALDQMAGKYDFETIDAGHSPDQIFTELQRRITTLFAGGPAAVSPAPKIAEVARPRKRTARRRKASKGDMRA
jgi:dTMP kinase